MTPDHKAAILQKSWLKTTFLLVVEFSAYITCVTLALYDSSFVLNVLFSIFAGAFIGFIFVLGHDAAHYAFTPSKLGNEIIGRICLIPTLHSFRLWQLLHNKYHHGFTNLKGKDLVWSPMSLEEYKNSSSFRRGLERVYRGLFGAGIYYMIEIWFKPFLLSVLFPSKSDFKYYVWDSVFVVVSGVIHAYGVYSFGKWIASDRSALEILSLGYFLPFLVWNYVIGFTVYMHHTHPNIPWYDEQKHSSFYETQIYISTRVSHPEPLQSLYININEHTAHHLLPSIPIYNLKKAQRLLENTQKNNITIIKNGLKEYFDVNKKCKLYDFKCNCWMNFDGIPTTLPIKWRSPS